MLTMNLIILLLIGQVQYNSQKRLYVILEILTGYRFGFSFKLYQNSKTWAVSKVFWIFSENFLNIFEQ